MWVDYRSSLSTVYNDGELSPCGWIIEVCSVQSTMMGRSQHVDISHIEYVLNMFQKQHTYKVHKTVTKTWTRTFKPSIASLSEYDS